MTFAPNFVRALLLAGMLLAPALASVVPAADVASGLVLHLPLTSNFSDEGPRRWPVTVHGRVEIRDGAAQFGGDGCWLELPFIPLFQRPFSVALWICPNEKTPPTCGLLEQFHRGEGAHHLYLMLRAERRPYFGIYVHDLVGSEAVDRPGVWRHVVFVFDGRAQEIYLDGKRIARQDAPAYHGREGLTCIGRTPRWSNVPSSDFQGAMRDVRIYRRALRTEHIATLSQLRPTPISR